MRLDHLSYAVGADGLAATSRRLEKLLGDSFVDGGVHPRFGTSNMVLALHGGRYLEVVAALDHPASDKAAFGQAVRTRTEAGGGWLSWVVSVDDLSPVESRLGMVAVPGNRRRPDGFELKWQEIGVSTVRADSQLPYFVHWEMDPDQHPSCGGAAQVRLAKLEISGDRDRVGNWLGHDPATPLADIDVEWLPPGSTPDRTSGIIAATFETRHGLVRI